MTNNNTWEVVECDDVGKTLRAVRDIRHLETVITDSALFMGPKTAPVCLGCLGSLAETAVLCRRCGWPVCGPGCESDPGHRAECEVLSEAGLVPSPDQSLNSGLYSSVSLLRLLLLQKTDVSSWRHVQGMMDHWVERRREKKVVEGVVMLHKLFSARLGLAWVRLEDVEHCYGVLKTNALDTETGGGQALYPVVCIMSHSCSPNLEPVSGPSTTVVFRAKRKIKQGEELTIGYTDFADSRRNIRRKIVKEWKFLCQCQRCSDPTEFGTNFSSFQCCCGGFYHEEDEETWKCSVCDKQRSDLSERYQQVETIFTTMASQNLDIDKLKNIYQDVEGVHDQFYMMIKLFMIFIEQNQHSSDRAVLELMIDKVDVVLKTLSMLEGGSSRRAAQYLDVRSRCQARLVKVQHLAQEITDAELKKGLVQVSQCRMMVARLMSR